MSTNSNDFRDKVLSLAGAGSSYAIRECHGVSNSAKFVPKGFLCGIPNIDGLSKGDGALLIFSKIQLSTESELHTAVLIRKNFNVLLKELEAMRRKGGAGETFFSDKNNNCAVFLWSDGKAYAYNKAKSSFEDLGEIIARVGEGVEPDALYWAVYGDPTDAQSTPIKRLEQLVGAGSFLRVNPSAVDASDLLLSSLDESVLTKDERAKPGAISSIPTSDISSALLSKPFLILTGPSGTGKTRGAIQFAESLCEPGCMAVVAVGADWTDNRHVVGYLNPLQTQDGTPAGPPIYESTEILKLLLHAKEHPDVTHVLILDEMNLSHVERYFADFLSAMELKNKKKALKLHSATLAKSREDADVEGSIDFPENLFVIGTVNIDETTYMFSPKVLDRANVIEIHADPTELGNFMKGIKGGRESEARDHGVPFLEAALVIQRGAAHPAVPDLPKPIRALAADRMLELFRIMKQGRGEFGFRTGREVLAYLRTAYFLTPANERNAWASEDGDWQKALDMQILQKILPKLHGSRTRLSPLLGALATYCGSGVEASAMEHFPKGANTPKRGLNDARGIATPKFEKSYKKLERMIEILVDEQFVSFIC